MDSISLLWAKTGSNGRWHPLWSHLLDTAAIAYVLQTIHGSVAPLPPLWLPYLTALHDLGKADPHFQAKDTQRAKALHAAGLLSSDFQPSPTFRHEARTAEFLQKYLITRRYLPLRKRNY
jgi:hypothetical protein